MVRARSPLNSQVSTFQGALPSWIAPAERSGREEEGWEVPELRSQADLNLIARGAPHPVTLSTLSAPQRYHPSNGYIHTFLLRCLSESLPQAYFGIKKAYAAPLRTQKGLRVSNSVPRDKDSAAQGIRKRVVLLRHFIL